MKTVLCVALASAVVLLIGAATENAQGFYSPNNRILYANADAFYNYDFLSHSDSNYNVDWPVVFLFYNNASINGVKNALDPPYGGNPSTKYEPVDDGAGWVWDADSGKKKGSCEGSQYHYRIYADGDDRLYNMDWGYYVIGTAHIDYHHCAPGTWFGMTESAEDEIAQDTQARWPTYNDLFWWYNPEGYREEGNHIWYNNGYTTYVGVGTGGGCGPELSTIPIC